MGVRIASPNPACCAACYGSNPGGRHVDFGAATDGPVVVNDDGTVRTWTGGTMSVEDIVLCEACVRAGAELLALEPTVMEGLAQEVRDAQADARLWRRRAESAQAALAEWGTPPPRPVRPHKAPTFVSDEEKAAAVELVRGGESVTAVAGELNVSAQAVRNWVRAAEAVDAGENEPVDAGRNEPVDVDVEAAAPA